MPSFIRGRFYRRRHTWLLPSKVGADLIPVTAASISIAGGTVGATDTTHVTEANAGDILRTDGTYVLRTDGSSHILREKSPAQITITGGTVTLSGTSDADEITVDAAALSVSGKTVGSTDATPTTAASISVSVKTVGSTDTTPVTAGEISVSGATVGAVDGEVVAVLAASLSASGKTVGATDTTAVTAAAVSIAGGTVSVADVIITGSLAATETTDTSSVNGRVNLTFIASAVPGGNNLTTNFSITIPTVLTDDLLILACTNRDSTNPPTITDTDTGGNTWTKKTSATSKGTLWYKRATSATSGKLVGGAGFTGSSSGVLIVLRGAMATGDPFANYTLEDNISGNEIHNGFTTPENGCWVGLAVHNLDNLSVSASSTTSPGALTEGTEKTSTGGNDSGTSLMGLLQVTAAATGNITWAQTNGVTVSQAFAIRPYQPSGTLAATETQDTASITGAAVLDTIDGSFALTEGTDTHAADGAVIVAGTIDATEAADAADLDGEITFGGHSVLRTDGTFVLRTDGFQILRTSTEPVTGTLDSAEATDTADIAGTIAAVGGLSAEDGHDAAVFAGEVAIAGTVDAVETADDATVFVTVADPTSTNSASLRTDDTYILRTDGSNVLRASAIQSSGTSSVLRTDDSYVLRTDGTQILRTDDDVATSASLRTDDTFILRTDGGLVLRTTADTPSISGTFDATETTDDASLSGYALFTPELTWATEATDATPDFYLDWADEFLDGDIVTLHYGVDSIFSAYTEINDTLTSSEIDGRSSTLGSTGLPDATYYVRARITQLGGVTPWSNTVTVTISGQISGALEASDVEDRSFFLGDFSADGGVQANDAADTASVVGFAGAFGTFALTEAADTTSIIEENVEATGTLVATEAADTASVAGTVAFEAATGTLAATETIDNLGLSGAIGGFISAVGGFSITEGQDTATFDAFIPCTGAMDAFEATDSAGFAGNNGQADGGDYFGAGLEEHYARVGKARDKERERRKKRDERLWETARETYQRLHGLLAETPEIVSEAVREEVAEVVAVAVDRPTLAELPEPASIDYAALGQHVTAIDRLIEILAQVEQARLEDEEDEDWLLLAS
jgi:hypothetical protein